MTRAEAEAARKVKRLANAARVKALADQGLNGKQIAARLSFSVSYAYELMKDPDGSINAKRRRDAYSGKCEDCGGPTYGGSIAETPERCKACYADQETRHSEAYIVDSMREWNRLFGEPPTAADWNPWWCRLKGQPRLLERAARYDATGRPWPHVQLCQKRFGSFSNALRAAGFEPIPAKYRWMGRAAYDAMVADQQAVAAA